MRGLSARLKWRIASPYSPMDALTISWPHLIVREIRHRRQLRKTGCLNVRG